MSKLKHSGENAAEILLSCLPGRGLLFVKTPEGGHMVRKLVTLFCGSMIPLWLSTALPPLSISLRTNSGGCKLNRVSNGHLPRGKKHGQG